MKKRWVKCKMNKALTLITLASTMMLMSPMILQTGSVVYAVTQNQDTVIVDNDVGKLDYTYHADDTTIYWSLSVNEKKAADSAYLRLKIDSLDAIKVAGQSIGKDETGWFVLDGITGSAKSYQVDFTTTNNGNQELPITAELVTPGEEGAGDQVQSLVANGTLKAEIPVVTELPEVATSSTEPKENIPSNESSEGNREVITDDQTQEADTGIQEQTVGDQTANADVEIMPLAVNDVISHGIAANGKSILDTRPGTPTTLPENVAEAGQEITFTSTYSVDGYGARGCNWTATIDTSLFSISGPISLSWVITNSNGTTQTGDPLSKTFDANGSISSYMDSLTRNQSLTYTFKLKVKDSISTDIRSSLVTKVTSQGNPTGISKTGYYWIKGDPITVTNGIKNVSGSDILVGEKENLGSKYASTDEKIEFSSTFTHPEKNSPYVWQATLHTGTIDITKRIRVYRQIGNSSKEDVTEEVSVNRNILTHNDEDANFSGEKITYWIEGITASAISDKGTKGNIVSEVACDVYKSTDTDYYWVKGNFYTLRNEITKENGDDLITFDAEIGESYANPSDGIALYSKFTLLPNTWNVEYEYQWSAKLDLDTLDVKVGDIVRIQRKVGDKWNTVTDVIIKTGGVIEYAIGSSSSDANYHYRIVSTENKNLRIQPDSKFVIDTKGIFSSSLSHRKRTWNWWDWGNWSDYSTPHSKTNSYWVKATIDNPTVLSWSDKESQTRLEETEDIIDLQTGYQGTFYWEDPDSADNILGALTFEVLETDSVEEPFVTMATQNEDGSATFTIPSEKLTHGTHNFTVQAYKGELKTGEPIDLQITVNGSVKLISVPSEVSWNLTVAQSKGEAISRSNEMKLEIQDSRSDDEKESAPWTLTVSSHLPSTAPFSLVWRDGGNPVDLNSTGITLGKTSSWSAANFVDFKTYGMDQGILLKSDEYLPVNTWNYTGATNNPEKPNEAILWSLNSTP
ncbi:hypothetical protein P7G51_09180 [Enterococcus asini]|uniref:hypothetical protein n=1 Tax=Enterococcus asini TaxID=57732 RepID=UPI00288D7447|nr:hypothetical protein [Enterococcus asini]MDT2757548.1 hypothetical protein [Enterococcus asini]